MKNKVVIVIAIVAGFALLVIDGLNGNANCESQRYDQTKGVCVDE